MKSLKDKTAFITGGASGIGLGIAKACAKQGAKVVIVDLRRDAIDSALQAFSENGWTAHGIELDVTDREAYIRAADEAEAVFGKIHILVNNAGIGAGAGPIWEVPYEQIDLGINVNLKGVLNGIHTVLPRILAHGEEGHVVSTASKAAIMPCPGTALYNLTKAAVCETMENLAIDLQGTNVGASAFCPGGYITNLGTSSGIVTEKHLGPQPPFAMPSAPAGDGEDAPPAFDFSNFDPSYGGLLRYPEDAGERVVRGILRGDIFILTHAEFRDGVKSRNDAVIRAFPEEAINPKYGETFKGLTYNEIYDKQTQVPKL